MILIAWNHSVEILVNHLIYYHLTHLVLVYYHLSILTLMEKSKKTKKDREPFYKGYGVEYLPGELNGLVKKLHLLGAEFFAGNTTMRNELVHVLDAFLRLKQLKHMTRKVNADITARSAASL